MNPPSTSSPLYVEGIPCETCRGDPDADCLTCRNSGDLCLTSCPMELVDAEARYAVRMAGHFERGMPPVSGGVLEQSAKFLSLVEFVRARDPSPHRTEDLIPMLVQLLTARG